MPETQNALTKFFNEDLDKPGVTGLAKKHERLILFIVSMIGLFGVYLAYKQQTSSNTGGGNQTGVLSTLPTSDGGGGTATGTGDTGTTTGTTGTTTPTNPITQVAFSLSNTVDNGINYLNSNTTSNSKSQGGGLTVAIGPLKFGSLNESGTVNSSSTVARQVQANQASSLQTSISGSADDVTKLLNFVTETQGTYDQRLAGEQALLTQAASNK